MRLLQPSLLLFALSGFGHAQVAPPWVRATPAMAGRVYAVGTATVAPSEAKAMEQAVQNARMEVIAALKVGVQGETNVSETLSEAQQSGSAATGSLQTFVRQSGTTTVNAVNLPGLVVEERFLDKKAGSAWALAYLDVAIAAKVLDDRISGLEADWKNAKAAPVEPGLRPAITRLQQVKAFQARASELGSEAGLLVAAHVPPAFRIRTQALGQDMGREIADSQKFLTMGARVQGGDLGADVLAMLRNSALKQGFLWTQNAPSIVLLIELRSARQGVNIYRKTWFDVDASSPDLVGTRAMFRISLADGGGEAQDSFDLDVKGVGTDAFSSEKALRKELQKVLPVRFEAFLRDLVK